MKDSVDPAAAPTTSPKKPKAKKNKAKKAANHPKYQAMITEAITELKDRHGSSRQAILKYIMKNFEVGSNETIVNVHLKLSLRAGVKGGYLKQTKGAGASGSFKLAGKPPRATKPKSPKKPKPNKPKAEKPKKAKSPKKAKKPKKDKKAKSPKKAKKPKKARKSPAEKEAKPKKARSPKKSRSPKKRAAPKSK